MTLDKLAVEYQEAIDVLDDSLSNTLNDLVDDEIVTD